MSDLIIVKVKDGINVEADMMRYWRNEIIMQKETGVILLPWYLTAIAVPEDTEIKIESEEQEHCEDAVSRADVRHLIAETNRNKLGRISTKAFKILYDGVDNLPPVNHQETVTEFADRCRECGKMRKGHWIFDDECKEHGHCSRCGYGSVDLVDGEPHNFCRKCGAWMVEPQERSGEV